MSNASSITTTGGIDSEIILRTLLSSSSQLKDTLKAEIESDLIESSTIYFGHIAQLHTTGPFDSDIVKRHLFGSHGTVSFVGHHRQPYFIHHLPVTISDMGKQHECEIKIYSRGVSKTLSAKFSVFPTIDVFHEPIVTWLNSSFIDNEQSAKTQLSNIYNIIKPKEANPMLINIAVMDYLYFHAVKTMDEADDAPVTHQGLIRFKNEIIGKYVQYDIGAHFVTYIQHDHGLEVVVSNKFGMPDSHLHVDPRVFVDLVGRIFPSTHHQYYWLKHLLRRDPAFPDDHG